MSDPLKTSVRLTDPDEVDEFRALAVLLGMRPHELAATMVRKSIAATRDDPDLYAHVQALVDGVRKRRAERAAAPDNVVPLHGGRR